MPQVLKGYVCQTVSDLAVTVTTRVVACWQDIWLCCVVLPHEKLFSATMTIFLSYLALCVDGRVTNLISAIYAMHEWPVCCDLILHYALAITQQSMAVVCEHCLLMLAPQHSTFP